MTVDISRFHEAMKRRDPYELADLIYPHYTLLNEPMRAAYCHFINTGIMSEFAFAEILKQIFKGQNQQTLFKKSAQPLRASDFTAPQSGGD